MYFFRCKTARQIAKIWPLAGDVWFFQYHLAPQTHDIFPFFGTGWIATCCDVAGCTGCNDLVDFHIRSAAPKHLTRLKLALIDFGHGVVIHSLGIPGFLQPCAEPGSAVHLSSWRVLRTQIAKMQWFYVVDTARFVARMAKWMWRSRLWWKRVERHSWRDGKKWPSCPEYGESEQEFWSHEWKKHGTCSGMGQLEYFKKALQMRDEYMNKCSKEGNQCSVCFGKNLTSQETCPTFTVSVWGILREGLRGSWLHGALAAALAAPSPPRLCCCKWHHTC